MKIAHIEFPSSENLQQPEDHSQLVVSVNAQPFLRTLTDPHVNEVCSTFFVQTQLRVPLIARMY
jgi:hypothetical protein